MDKALVSEPGKMGSLWGLLRGSRRNIGKNPVWGLGVSGGAILIFNLNKRVAQSSVVLILLHFGLVTFNFHFPKAPKVINFMIFGLGGRAHESQNQVCVI